MNDMNLAHFMPSQLSPGSEEDDHEGPVCEKLGRIQFSVGYSFQDSTLTVKILKGQDLPAKDFSGTSDPFVKLYLLPDKKHKLETKVKRKNLNPHWNETFLFEGVQEEAFLAPQVSTPVRTHVAVSFSACRVRTVWCLSQGSHMRRWSRGPYTYRSLITTGSAGMTP